MNSPTVVLITLLLQIQFLDGRHALDHFCPGSGPVTINLALGEADTIKTLYDGQDFYSEDMNCEWNIISQGHRLQVEVLKSDLQYAQPGSLCANFDHIQISNGYSEY